MKIEDLINNGFKQNLPIYYNKVSIIDYNKTENKKTSCKRVQLNKYNSNGFITNKCYKLLTKISK